jgi:hypothetical protein
MVNIIANAVAVQLVRVAENNADIAYKYMEEIKRHLLRSVSSEDYLKLDPAATRALLGTFRDLIPNSRNIFEALPVGAGSSDDEEQFVFRGYVAHVDGGPRVSVVIVVNLFIAAILREVLIAHHAWIDFTVHHSTRRPPGCVPTSPSATLASSPGSGPTSPSAAERRK